jgi:hypothetical protein
MNGVDGCQIVEDVLQHTAVPYARAGSRVARSPD